jgi:hypothetical protein
MNQRCCAETGLVRIDLAMGREIADDAATGIKKELAKPSRTNNIYEGLL